MVAKEHVLGAGGVNMLMLRTVYAIKFISTKYNYVWHA